MTINEKIEREEKLAKALKNEDMSFFMSYLNERVLEIGEAVNPINDVNCEILVFILSTIIESIKTQFDFDEKKLKILQNSCNSILMVKEIDESI